MWTSYVLCLEHSIVLQNAGSIFSIHIQISVSVLVQAKYRLAYLIQHMCVCCLLDYIFSFHCTYNLSLVKFVVCCSMPSL